MLEPDAPREGWKSSSPHPAGEAPGPSPCAAGSWGVTGAGGEIQPRFPAAALPAPAGTGMFPRCLVLFWRGQGCACPPVAPGLVPGITRARDLF